MANLSQRGDLALQPLKTLVKWLSLLHNFIQQSKSYSRRVRDLRWRGFWQWSRLEIRLNTCRRSTIPQQFIIIITFTNTRPIATKLASMVTYHVRLPAIKEIDHLITRSFEITRPTKNIEMTTLPMTTKFGSDDIKRSPLINLYDLYSRALVKLRDKLSTLYPHLHYTNGYQTWQGGDLLWEASTHKVA